MRFIGFLSVSLAFAALCKPAMACDEVQLATNFIQIWQLENVGNTVLYSTRASKTQRLQTAITNHDGQDIKALYEAYVKNTNDPEAKKHFDGCADYENYFRVARHSMSCYPNEYGKTTSFAGYGSPSTPEAQAIGIKKCVRIGGEEE